MGIYLINGFYWGITILDTFHVTNHLTRSDLFCGILQITRGVFEISQSWALPKQTYNTSTNLRGIFPNRCLMGWSLGSMLKTIRFTNKYNPIKPWVIGKSRPHIQVQHLQWRYANPFLFLAVFSSVWRFGIPNVLAVSSLLPSHRYCLEWSNPFWALKKNTKDAGMKRTTQYNSLNQVANHYLGIVLLSLNTIHFHYMVRKWLNNELSVQRRAKGKIPARGNFALDPDS